MTKKILRVDLKNDYKERYDKIKEINRYETDAETIRALIDHFKPGKNQVMIPTELLLKIDEELENSRTRIKYGIFNTDEFVFRAIIYYLDKIRTERGSLLEWDVRSELSDTQREIAIAFFELQSKNSSGLTKEMISDFLNKSEKEIVLDLEELVNARLLEKHGPYYYAP